MWGSEKGSEGVVELARLGNAVRGAGGEGCEHGHCAYSKAAQERTPGARSPVGTVGLIGTAPCSAEFSER